MNTITKRDPQSTHTRSALAHLAAAQHARTQYESILSHAVRSYGERHAPDKPFGVQSPCTICVSRGLHPTPHETLNHQTGSIISGIYSDHFPDVTKESLRTYAGLISEHTQMSIVQWREAGRRISTLRPLIQISREIVDGVVMS